MNPGASEVRWPSRRSIRLQRYNYSQPGAYYVTVCSAGRECLFGDVVEGDMRLSAFGSEVEDTWDQLPNHYPRIDLDAFVVMPNHVHGVLALLDGRAPGDEPVGAGLRPARDAVPTRPYALSEVIRAFKSFSARRINVLRGTAGAHVWQRNYYERIIRNERELERIREYIDITRRSGPMTANIPWVCRSAERSQTDVVRWMTSSAF